LLWRNGLRSQGKWQVLHAFMRRRVELPGDPPLYMGAPAGKKRIYVASPLPLSARLHRQTAVLGSLLGRPCKLFLPTGVKPSETPPPDLDKQAPGDSPLYMEASAGNEGAAL